MHVRSLAELQEEKRQGCSCVGGDRQYVYGQEDEVQHSDTAHARKWKSGSTVGKRTFGEKQF